MQKHSRFILVTLRAAVVATAVTAFGMGCGGDDKVADTGGDPVDYSPNVNDDVATSVAAMLAAENGGVADQLVDIVSLAGSYGLKDTNLIANQSSPNYNPASHTWEWAFAREYSSANGLYFARVERTYRWRFLKKDGEPQVTYISANDTAYTIELTLVSGAGRHLMPFLSQTLHNLSGRLVATGTNTDELTINGYWSRSALDTIRTRYAVRTFVHACSLSVSDMHCRRDSTTKPWRSVSGTITGLFSADIQFVEGDAYAEDTVSRELTIALDTGVATIALNDTAWTCDLRRGEMR